MINILLDLSILVVPMTDTISCGQTSAFYVVGTLYM